MNEAPMNPETSTEKDPRIEKLQAEQEAVNNSLHFTTKILEDIQKGYITSHDALSAVEDALKASKYAKEDRDAYEAIEESLSDANLTDKGASHIKSHQEQFSGLFITRGADHRDAMNMRDSLLRAKGVLELVITLISRSDLEISEHQAVTIVGETLFRASRISS